MRTGHRERHDRPGYRPGRTTEQPNEHALEKQLVAMRSSSDFCTASRVGAFNLSFLLIGISLFVGGGGKVNSTGKNFSESAQAQCL